MVDPTGAKLQLPFRFILNSPFPDYFFPGLILFTALGLSSLIVAFGVISHWKCCSTLVMLQGIIICGWIIVQVLLIKVLFWLQFLIMGIGIALIALGFFEKSARVERN